MCIMFYTMSIYFIMLSANSSILLRFWNALGFFVILYMSTYASLFFLFVCRFLDVIPMSMVRISGDVHNKRQSDISEDEERSRIFSKLAFFSLISLGVFLIFMFISMAALIIYVIPYELEQSNGDYANTAIEYFVSTMTVAIMLVFIIELWDNSFNNEDSFIFVNSYYKSGIVQKGLEQRHSKKPKVD